MLILLDSRDLINLAERSSPVSVKDFDAYLRAGSHQLVLSFTNVRELVSPLAGGDEFLRIRPLLQALESLPHTYIREVTIVGAEIQAAVDAFSRESEYQPVSPFVDRWDRTLVMLPGQQRSAADGLVGLRLDEIIYFIYKANSGIFSAPEHHLAGLRTLFEQDRAALRARQAPAPKHFVASVKKHAASHGVALPAGREDEFAEWVYSSPDRCPGLRLNHEVYRALIANYGDNPETADFSDLAHVFAVPYVGAATLDRRMRHYCGLASQRLVKLGSAESFSERLHENTAAIMRTVAAPEIRVPTRSRYEPVIGLEVHVQLLTVTKIFCSCSAKFGAPPNTNVCPVCLGLPGALPVLNRKAVQFAALAAMALNCRINETSIFARKNYFYPDLPKGYQISQYDRPLAEFGWISIPVANHEKKIGITRLHLEEDAGKSLHEGFEDSTETTAIDLNRSGVPLIEIVSEPDIASPDEAYEYLTRLKEIILYTGVSDCNMEEGSLRCDANVSVRPVGQKQFGTKAEVKNVNSFRFIRDALEYEVDRQISILESGGKVTQETRLYDPNQGKTYTMRSKEEAHDYRYFPEPDLLPLLLDENSLREIRSTLPELPDARRSRMIAEYGITAYDAQVLTASKTLADEFESAAKRAKNPKRVANLVQSELMGRLKSKGFEISQSPISMKGVAMSADLVESGAISGKMLKDLYDLCFDRSQDFPQVFEKEKPQQITDSSEIQKIIDDVLAANPKQLEQYRAGKKTVMGFFVGQVMKATKGQANPQLVNELLGKKLEG